MGLETGGTGFLAETGRFSGLGGFAAVRFSAGLVTALRVAGRGTGGLDSGFLIRPLGGG